MNNLKLSNLNKIYWPDEKYTKKDLIEYYLKIKDVILPYLKDRPVSMNRFPDGILGSHFYQKDTANLKVPGWIETICVNDVNYIMCQNAKTLIYLVNLGCIEINVWNSRKDSLDFPDYLVLDLDPVEIDFKEVVKIAKVVKSVLDQIGLEGFAKTSGASGIHIYIPTGGRYDYEQVKQLGKILATVVHKQSPQNSSVERIEEKRTGKVYIDYLQNNKGQTMASVYSVRPVAGALVSTPLAWNELNEKLHSDMFNIKKIPKRVNKKGDLFQPILSYEGFDMEAVLSRLKKEFTSS